MIDYTMSTVVGQETAGERELSCWGNWGQTETTPNPAAAAAFFDTTPIDGALRVGSHIGSDPRLNQDHPLLKCSILF